MARTTIRTEDITADAVTSAKIAAGAVDTTGLEDDIALLGFKVASNGSLAKYNLVDQTVDDFQDASGVNASESTNEERDSSGKYYKGIGTTAPSVSGNYDSTAVDGDYTYYKWTTATSSGSYTTDVAQDYEYLVVAGGGGGGGSEGGGGAGAGNGGGGAGGYKTATGFAVAATTISGITVGAGGAGGSSGSGYAPGTSGGDSVFSSITSTGGGGGGSPGNGLVGGSGGGSGYNGSGGAGTVGQGNNGGASNTSSPFAGSGGGGASAVGNGAAANNVGGAGGAGTASSISGGSVTYAGGGGGGGGFYSPSNTGGAGGAGGGGAGGSSSGSGGAGAAATANTGGGGGGSAAAVGGVGGAGIVIIRRLTGPVEAEGGNMTLVSTTTAAKTGLVPSKGDIVLTYTNGAGTTTLDTDLTAEISADGGSTWTDLPLASEGSTGSHNIATSHDITIDSTITAPYNMAYRIKTLNQSVSKTTRIQAVSLGWS